MDSEEEVVELDLVRRPFVLVCVFGAHHEGS
jgi:hypothetical protein